VPGGVGPLTIAMVLRNTITAAELRQAAARSS
jgi:5,10-methylene-tetrahydrofolate dehydrogenase/methenyl tetrahydrofolate cyclohydrolase